MIINYEIYPELLIENFPIVKRPCYWMGGDRYVDHNGNYVSGPNIDNYIVDCRSPEELQSIKKKRDML